MSMTISAANYLGSTRQNDPIRFPEDRKDSGAEAGKTEQTGGSASCDQLNLGEDGVAIAQVSRQQGAEQSTGQRRSPGRDTVEISAEGQAACAKREQAASAEAYPYKAEDLSEYTDTELKQMYRRGEITRQEYEDETGETVE